MAFIEMDFASGSGGGESSGLKAVTGNVPSGTVKKLKIELDFKPKYIVVAPTVAGTSNRIIVVYNREVNQTSFFR